MVDLAKGHTSPSIERSVLLRMGFSSLECKPIVEQALGRGLLGKGAGHIVYKLAKAKELSIRDTGLKLAAGQLWDEAESLFKASKGAV